MAYLFVRFATNFENPELDFIPKPVQDQIPYQGLTDLRVSLIQRGMAKKAMQVFRVEFAKIPLNQRQAKADEVLNTLASILDLKN